MDDLDLIRSLRAGVPGPTATARDRALSAVRAGRTARRRGLPRGPRARGVAAAAAIAVAVVVVALTTDGEGTLSTGDARAAQKLNQAADAALRTPGPGRLREGQYWYTRSRSGYLTTIGDAPPYSYLAPAVREDWLDRDGGGLARQRPAGDPIFPGPRDRERWRASGSPPLAVGDLEEIELGACDDAPGGDCGSFFLGNDAIDYEGLLALPTATDALYERLRDAAAEGGGSSVDDELFTIVGDTLRSTPAPPPLRAALYRVAARVPGVIYLGEMRDAVGRPGVGVARDDQGVRSVLIFDPETGAMLGEEDRQLEPVDYVDARPGDRVGFVAYVESGVVDSTEERP